MPRHFLVGGGIASLAAAVFLIRDAGVSGADITIVERERRLGGSLDGAGDAASGYLVRGGRMFEKNFACTFDLLGSIPAGPGMSGSVKDDIFAFNEEVRGSSRCRLMRGGERADPSFGLRGRDLIDLLKLSLADERSLEGRTIASVFDEGFFESNFWIMWATTFAFQRWHSAVELKRYFRRFIHLFPGFKKLEGVLRTRFNQYDSLIAPVEAWLLERGVQFERAATVTDARIARDGEKRTVNELTLMRGDGTERIEIHADERVYFTLGSMTEGSVIGSNDAPPPAAETDDAWALWSRLALRDPAFGRPDAFRADIDLTKWESFTVTLRDPAFFRFVEELTGNPTGTGGLITFADAGWTLSIVMFHQPHFRDQAGDAWVFWGYGLRGDRHGAFVQKPMGACSGDEILAELAGHLKLGDRAAELFRSAIVKPCMMPLITSQFMPRRSGDRPKVVPDGAQNFAILGQFCEQSTDVVFTVEYSVRSAKTAVHLLAGGPPPPPVRREDRNPVVLFHALRTAIAG